MGFGGFVLPGSTARKGWKIKRIAGALTELHGFSTVFLLGVVSAAIVAPALTIKGFMLLIEDPLVAVSTGFAVSAFAVVMSIWLLTRGLG